MRKLIALLFVILNIVIFFNTRDVFFQKDELEMVRGIDAAYWYMLSIENINNDSISHEESRLVFDFFEELVSTYDLVILFSEFEDGLINHYVMAVAPIDEVFNLTTTRSVKFPENDAYFYTNRKNIENGIHFFLLNDLQEVNIFPMWKMQTLYGGMYGFLSDDQEELLQVVELFANEFPQIINREWSFQLESSSFDYKAAIQDSLAALINIAQVFSFFLVLFYVHLNSKKIAVLKTMGHSIFSLCRFIFTPLLLMIILSIFVTQGILFVGFVRVFNERTLPFILSLMQSMTAQLVGVFITFFLGSLVLLWVPLYLLVKKKTFTRLFMTANFLIKIMLLLIILPIFNVRFLGIRENLGYLQLVRHYRINGNMDHFQFSTGLMSRYSADGHFSTVLEILNEQGEDLDPSLIYDHELILQYHQAFGILNEAGAVMSFGGLLLSGDPVLNVNENFLRRHPILGIDGEVIDLSRTAAHRVYLVPESQKGRPSLNLMRGADVELFYIQENQEVFDYSLDWAMWGIVDSPYIISVQMDSAFDLQASPFGSLFYEGDINERLSETPFFQRIRISTIGDELNAVRTRHLLQLREHLVVVIPLVLMIIFISSQFAYLYTQVYLKRILASKVMGYSDFYIWRHLLAELVIGIFAAMSIARYLRMDFRWLFAVIILDIAVYLGTMTWSRLSPSFKMNGQEGEN